MGWTAKYKMLLRSPIAKVEERQMRLVRKGELEVCLRTEQLMVDRMKEEEEADQ